MIVLLLVSHHAETGCMLPRQISQIPGSKLRIVWDDGHVETVALSTLRDHCPCASCQGETVLLHSVEPLPQQQLPGRTELKGAEQVGSYALKLIWGDGHDTGLYTWERLRSLCECEDCTARSASSGV